MSMSRRPASSPLLAAGLAAASLLVPPAEARAGAAPDILVYDVDGPEAAAAGENVVVTTKCDNPGGYYNGVIYVEIRLSADKEITEDDLLVDLEDFNNFATQKNPKSIFKLPSDLPSGTYYWGSTVQKVGGEVNLSNNADHGNQVVIDGVNPPASDLCLDSDATVNAYHTVGAAFPLPITRSVENCGENGSTLNWVLTGAEPSWISVSSSSGSVQKGAPQSTTIQLNPSGLVPNLYQTTLEFENTEDPTDYERIDVNLVVGTVDFVPGDKISGTTTPSDAVHTRTFLGSQGMTLKLSTKKLDKKLKLLVTVRDDQGSVVDVASMKKSGKKKKASMGLPSDGLYTLTVETLKGTGNYTIKTKGKVKN